MAGRSLRAAPDIQPGAAGVRRRIGAMRAGVEPGQPDHVPDRAGASRRDPARDHDDDLVADRAPGPSWRRSRHVRAGGRDRSGGRTGAGRVPGRVRELAADLFHQHTDRNSRGGGRNAGVATIPDSARAAVRHAGLHHRGEWIVRPAAGAVGG